MKVHTASLIVGLIFAIGGSIMWYKLDYGTKWFDVGTNLMVIGAVTLLTMGLAKIKVD